MARPVYVLECAFGSNPDDPLSSQVWTDITRYLDVQAGLTITRGRDDEQSDVQPSTLSLTLDNRTGAFTPGNTSSPFYPNVKTGKRIRLALAWPGNGKQLYPDDPGFEGTASFGWESKPGQPTTTIGQSGSQAQSGTKSMQLTLPTATAGQAIVRRFVYGLVAGRQYTASLYLRVPTGSPAMNFGVTPGSSVTTTLTNTFERKAITFTATGPYCEIYVYTNAASTAGQAIQVDSVQIEEGSSATAWESTPGTLSWRFTGDVTEWPLGWDGSPGLYASTKLAAVDRLGKLGSLGEYRTTIEEDILDDKPFAFYPMQEAPLSQSSGDVSGNYETPLTTVQLGTGGDLQYGGEPGAQAFWNDQTVTVGFNPVNATNGKYLRAILKKPTSGTTGAAVTVYAREGSTPVTTGPIGILTAADGSWFGVNKAASGNMTAGYYNAATGTLSEVVSGYGIPTDYPVQLSAVLDIPSAGNGRITFYVNSVATGTAVTFPMAAVPSWTQVSVGGRAKQLFRGNILYATFYDYPVSTAALAGQWYGAFQGRDGAGNTTYSRLAKLCVYSNLGTLAIVGNFTPQAVGGQEIQGNPLDAMRLIEDTEGGVFYIDGLGAPVLAMRNYRFNAAPSITLTADRLDPEALTFRGDDFGMVNDVTASQPSGATTRVVNQASVDDHGRRKASLNAIPATDTALTELAAWRANTNGSDRNRITGVTVSLLNDPALIRPVLVAGSGIGRKVSITALPAQAPATSLSVYIEGVTEVVGENEWSMAWSTSPGEVGDVWQIGVAGHSEIGTTTRIGY